MNPIEHNLAVGAIRQGKNMPRWASVKILSTNAVLLEGLASLYSKSQINTEILFRTASESCTSRYLGVNFQRTPFSRARSSGG